MRNSGTGVCEERKTALDQRAEKTPLIPADTNHEIEGRQPKGICEKQLKTT